MLTRKRTDVETERNDEGSIMKVMTQNLSGNTGGSHGKPVTMTSLRAGIRTRDVPYTKE